MNLRRAALVFESELTTYARRQAFLLRELRRNPLGLDVGPSGAAPGADGADRFVTRIDLVIDGPLQPAMNCSETPTPPPPGPPPPL